MNVVEGFKGFIAQSQRVLAVTHKPRGQEYRQMAITTALGITIIGLIGFAINFIAHALRG
ncbi:protein translocase SEC61 complex subunit gamma [Candidatus Micrarchaeota archaeon]|nr:protein translocase SEC61 complex subunit gamma [Candidatus Micrarchaeota archaeon]